MLLAKKLKQENIAEYLLYMWQIEDLIRANELDIERIKDQIVNKYDQPQDIKKEIEEWYANLIEMMRLEDKTQKGHLIINDNIISDLTDLHLRLLKSQKESDYISTYYKTLPFIVELRTKYEDKTIPELETAFTALYGFLLMRLEGKTISGETQAAISQISSLLRILSQKYKADREGILELD